MKKENYYPCLYWFDKVYVLRKNGRFYNLSNSRAMVSYKTREHALLALKKANNEYNEQACKKMILTDKEFDVIQNIFDDDNLYFDYQKTEAIYNVIKKLFV